MSDLAGRPPSGPVIFERAPAKLNLLLHVGARRADGLHELCSLFASVEPGDELAIEVAADAGAGSGVAGARPRATDAVSCPGVEGPNLAAAALAAFRGALSELGRGSPLDPLSVTIHKRIPVAAGLGGGSADAAAVLRAANELAGHPLDGDELRRLGATLGADVPSQVDPRHALVTGAGELVEPIDLPEMALVLVPGAEGLATAEVYAEADRLGATRERLDPDRARRLAAGALRELAAGLENDLEAAVLSLRPGIDGTLSALRGAGALSARVTGSGPTAFGVFEHERAAAAAAATISGALRARLRAPEPSAASG